MGVIGTEKLFTLQNSTGYNCEVRLD
jgi:hypothetical protein